MLLKILRFLFESVGINPYFCNKYCLTAKTMQRLFFEAII